MNMSRIVLTGSPIDRARSYAAKAHEGQKYGDEFSYFVHVWAAYNVALRFGIVDEDVLCAVLLHDVLEDTPREYEDLVTFFRERVANIVKCVTEPKNGTRRERHADAYPRIKQDEDARIVKLCDRISHVEFGGKKIGMYRKEHVAFKQALGEPMSEIEQDMWDYLDSLLAQVEPSVSV
jgi:(p)ppGpp synthase/HD superfamily hydrolase